MVCAPLTAPEASTRSPSTAETGASWAAPKKPTYQPVGSPLTCGPYALNGSDGSEKLSVIGAASTGASPRSSRRPSMVLGAPASSRVQAARYPVPPAPTPTSVNGCSRHASVISPGGGGPHGDVHVALHPGLPGGSQLSPGSTTPLPQKGGVQNRLSPSQATSTCCTHCFAHWFPAPPLMFSQPAAAPQARISSLQFFRLQGGAPTAVEAASAAATTTSAGAASAFRAIEPSFAARSTVVTPRARSERSRRAAPGARTSHRLRPAPSPGRSCDRSPVASRPGTLPRSRGRRPRATGSGERQGPAGGRAARSRPPSPAAASRAIFRAC